eukprot:scaffold43993_cov65-Cyclotella_meneghiniana.AAC.1
MTKLFDLTGKTALITGGGTGIGAAIAKGLAEAGAKVVLVGRREEPLNETAAKINDMVETDGVVAFSLPADIMEYDKLPELVDKAKLLAGGTPVTIIVNNAGINVRQTATDLTPQHWGLSLELMLTAPFFLARACSDGFRQEKYGRIINIASLQSCQEWDIGIGEIHGRTFLNRSNVTVNNLGPGYVKTDLTASVFADEERAQRLADATLFGRNSVPDDLVGPAIFLASPASAYVTGQTLMCDGGFTSLGMR